ncbi:hypothetical protein MIMGU_mgv1a025270mg, partial [Erythranthe guttata]
MKFKKILLHIQEYSETNLQKLPIGIHKEMIQLIKIHNADRIHTILHYSTNIICFVILSGSSILGNEELVILNSWAQEFLYNLSDSSWIVRPMEDLFLGTHERRYRISN